jgi:hypothetical protein
MEPRMYTLLLVDGCHYIDTDDANRVAVAVREGLPNVEIVAHISAIPGSARTARVATKDVLKLIAHDVMDSNIVAQPVSISSFRSKRSGRSGPAIPSSAR